MVMKKIKKFWSWLWHSNSLASWIVLAILAFLFVKFIFFPFFGFLLKTNMPFVIVESYSMQHCYSIKSNPLWHCSFEEYWKNYKDWYEERNISKEKFESFSFKNGLDAGDIAVLKGKKEYGVGDIIVFVADNKPIIHRIVSKNCQEKCVYETKGDNNYAQLPFEKNISQKQVIGKVIIVIPKLGWIKLLPYKIWVWFKSSLIS
jgi:signal peptidase I